MEATATSDRYRDDPRRTPSRAGVVWIALTSALLGPAACLAPWSEVTVSPTIRGRVERATPTEAPVRMRLVVRHRENPALHHVEEIPIGPGNDFSFAPIVLSAAGKEYSKFYRAFLQLHEGEQQRVVWRAEFSRRRLSGTVDLRCDLQRAVALGQPCRVVEPASQDWLVDHGRREFGLLCSTCHGVEGRGTANGAPDLTRIAARSGAPFDPDATARWIEGRSAAEAHFPEREMPVWGERLSEEYARYARGEELIGAKLDPIVAFLEAIQRTP